MRPQPADGQHYYDSHELQHPSQVQHELHSGDTPHVYKLAAAAAAAAAGVDSSAAAARAVATVYASQHPHIDRRQQRPPLRRQGSFGNGGLAGGTIHNQQEQLCKQQNCYQQQQQLYPQQFFYQQQQQLQQARPMMTSHQHAYGAHDNHAPGPAGPMNGYQFNDAMSAVAPTSWPAVAPMPMGAAMPGPAGYPPTPAMQPPSSVHNNVQPLRQDGWGGGAVRGGGGGGGRGGRHSGGSRGGAPGRGGRKWKPGGPAGNDGADSALEALLWTLRRAPAGQPLDGDALSRPLSGVDSRGAASLLKELARLQAGGGRAREVFDWLCSLPPGHPQARLCDVFTFTAMVSLCVEGQELARAMGLVEEMRARGVPRNVHTFSALMNVCIKSGQLQQALTVYRTMLSEGCQPNVVTFNTLIDVYGKTGQWSEALGVLRQMEASGAKPVTRTFNTLMIACNASGQWQEALGVYESMLRAGHTPNTTTYNALISAHSRAGSLERVMETFREMVQNGCERSVITYSALISACEKAGQWQTALDLFRQMTQEGCAPNVITYNSLITACGQGAQWRNAAEIFQRMQRSGCRPDVVTYTALISAYERGGEWLRALEAFRLMQDHGCMPDSILYSALLDALWDTGIAWAQAKAARLYRQATKQGHFRKLPDVAGAKLELPLQQLSPGMAMLALHCWLADIGAAAESRALDCAPATVSILLGRPRQRDPTAAVVRDSVCALLRSYDSPFAPQAPDGGNHYNNAGSASANSSPRSAAGGGGPVTGAPAGSGGANSNSSAISSNGTGSKLEAAGCDVLQWLQTAVMQHALDAFGAPQQPAPPQAAAAACPDSDAAAADADAAAEAEAGEDLAHIGRERAAELRSREAFGEVAQFESTRCLSVQRMGPAFLSERPALVARGVAAGAALGLPPQVAHDAVLLLDRATSTGVQLEGPLLPAALAACLFIVIALDYEDEDEDQEPGPGAAASDPRGAPASDARLEECRRRVSEAAGVPQELLRDAEGVVKDALRTNEFPEGDFEAISAIRCLDLYADRLTGTDRRHAAGDDGCGGQLARRIVGAALGDPEFLNYRPSIAAAAAVYCARMQRGRLPFWPTALSSLTGYSDGSTPELAAAIRGAHRIARAIAAAGGGAGPQGAHKGCAPPPPAQQLAAAPPQRPSAGGGEGGGPSGGPQEGPPAQGEGPESAAAATPAAAHVMDALDQPSAEPAAAARAPAPAPEAGEAAAPEAGEAAAPGGL